MIFPTVPFSIVQEQSFSNCGMRITFGTPASVQWYIMLVRKIQWIQNKMFFSNKCIYIEDLIKLFLFKYIK
jgi:hypothetical protein